MTTNASDYNGLDARVSKTDSTGTYGFKRNGAGVTDAVLSDGAATYTPGISERRAGSSKFLHSGMKNADAQSGASANVDSSRTYDAFGNLTGSSGTWSGPFGYAGGFGYQEDPDHGLRLLGHRYYDSSTGRFISKDPAGAGRNWNTYCSNSPISAADPEGLREITGVDKSRLHRLREEMHRQGMSAAYINQVTNTLKGDIAQVSGTQDPARLQALWWAIDHLGSAEYGQSLFSPQAKCNQFVGDAYALGAGLGYDEYCTGGQYPVHQGRFKNSPIGANSLSDPSYHSDFLPVIPMGDAKPGDIVSFESSGGGGHTTLKVANGLLIYAGRDGAKVQTYEYVNADGHHGRNKTARRFVTCRR